MRVDHEHRFVGCIRYQSFVVLYMYRNRNTVIYVAYKYNVSTSLIVGGGVNEYIDRTFTFSYIPDT